MRRHSSSTINVAVRRAGRRSRRGVTLVYFALLLMGVMAIAGLAIDMGLVLLTRRQMQAAVNTAALEALRNGPQAASDLVDQKIFRDQSGQNIKYGAGPYIPYQGGIAGEGSNFIASQYLPLPYLNSGSQQNGSEVSGPWLPPALDYTDTLDTGADIVAGQYQGDSSSHVEGDASNPYNRGDFTSQATSTNSRASDSMLVRMRRSIEQPSGTLPAGATGGPPVPAIFSRGDPLLLFDGNPLLADGFTVRATAIAQWTPAVSIRLPNANSTRQVSGVGFAYPIPSGLALIPSPTQLPYAVPLQWPSSTQWLALTDQFWVALTDQEANSSRSTPIWTTTQTTAGEIYQTATLTTGSNATYNFLDPNSTSGSSVAAQVISTPLLALAAANSTNAPVVVGQIVQPFTSVPAGTPQAGLVAIYHQDPQQSVPRYLLGFAYVGFTPNSNGGTVTRYFTTSSVPPNYPPAGVTSPPPVFVTRAVHNASATFGAAAPAELSQLMAQFGLQSTDIAMAMNLRSNPEYSTSNLIFDPATGARRSSVQFLLSAPALVRTMAAPIPSN